MSNFSIGLNKTLKEINIIHFKNKREIQDYIELNLNTTFNLQFIKSEMAVGDLRIDTLAYDADRHA
jgi:hypothetical protein